jgi:hypothetical protein
VGALEKIGLVDRIATMTHDHNHVLGRKLDHVDCPVLREGNLFASLFRLVKSMRLGTPTAHSPRRSRCVLVVKRSRGHQNVLPSQEKIHLGRTRDVRSRILLKSFDSRRDASGWIVVIVVPEHDILSSLL